jgi:hypothetical protein
MSTFKNRLILRVTLEVADAGAAALHEQVVIDVVKGL